MIAEIGLPHAEIQYEQRHRKSGKSNNNFYTLYDLAMLGITKLSKVRCGSLLFPVLPDPYFRYSEAWPTLSTN